MGIFKGTPKKSATAASSSSSKASPAQAGKEVSPQRQQASPQDSPAPSSAAAVPLAPLPENKEPAFLSDDGLRELLTRKLKDQQGSIYTESTQASSKYTDLRYAKFTIAGFPGVKHAVFIPDNLKLSPPVLQQVCSAIDKEMPCMLLQGVSSLCHPAKMSTPQLRKCRGLRQLMSDSKSSLRMPGGEDPEAGGCCCKPRTDGDANELQVNDAELSNKELIKVANHVLEKKVASTISSVATAACRTNVWTFTGPNLSNFEIFLQQGLETGETEIFRMVAAHMQDKAYMECSRSRRLMRDLFENSQEMSSEGVSYVQPITLRGDLWDPAMERSNQEFAEHGFDYWSFNDYDENAVAGHPIALWPWPHADLFLLFYREDRVNGSTVPEVDWEYRTERRLDLDAIPFVPETFAPVGYVFFGSPHCWGPQTKKKLLQGIKLANPVVLLDNTPNVAKQISLFVNVVKKVWDRAPIASCRPFLDDAAGARLSGTATAVEIMQALSPSKIMQHVKDNFDSSGMDACEKLTLSDVVGLLDVLKRRPHAFREVVCVVDPLADSPERVVPQLMSVFTSQTGLREANPTMVHRSLVTRGWALHLRLVRSEQQLRRFVMGTSVLIALAMVLSALIAMFLVWLSISGKEVRQLAEQVPFLEDALHLLLVALPICAAFLMIVQSNFQVGQKWASVHMASSRVVSEIYHFLGNVAPYTAGPVANQKRFQKRLRRMVKCLSISGVHEEDLLGRENSSEDLVVDDFDLLQQQINSSLYGIRPHHWCCRRMRGWVGSFGFSHPWAALLLDEEQRDLVAPVTSESYMELRITPLRMHYANMVRSLTHLRMVLHCCLVLSLVASVACGAAGAACWVPVTMGLGAFVASLEQWLAPSDIFSALNSALITLNNFDLRWQVRDIRENRSQATKDRLIVTMEKIALNIARSTSRATLLPEVDGGEEDSDEEGAEERTATQQRLLSQPLSVPVSPVVTTPAQEPSGGASGSQSTLELSPRRPRDYGARDYSLGG